ncbi:type II toxin-antitoxin system prevent-host-death family antitoxin [Methylorubrum sp. SB2]|uniref:type II toxin-antitoxin system Phd/YefM family antitoxin n=1 Tax=Methylorubrum subtropicum TaxID=3138812 RepID=UPI00313E418E
MTSVSLDDASSDLADLTRRVEAGETIVLTRAGRPVADLVPHRPRGGIDLEAGYRYLREQGLPDPFPYVADDFDAPLPEDFLLKPLP